MLPALSFSFVNSNTQTLIITLRNLLARPSICQIIFIICKRQQLPQCFIIFAEAMQRKRSVFISHCSGARVPANGNQTSTVRAAATSERRHPHLK
jgi:hypothetical protein